MRRVSSAWPSTLLILCEPVCVRSSRFSSTRTPSRSDSRAHSVTGVGRPGVAREQRRVLGAERVVVPGAGGTPLRAVRARATSVSGAKRPPNSPKRPRPTGSGPGRLEVHGRAARGTDIRAAPMRKEARSYGPTPPEPTEISDRTASIRRAASPTGGSRRRRSSTVSAARRPTSAYASPVGLAARASSMNRRSLRGSLRPGVALRRRSTRRRPTAARAGSRRRRSRA